ncbi:acetoacetyl-CoA synthetase-like [Halichondria panicea]|uniref:acetoacetyl-CoA synthetase-like n=1 Tax=Halichondria panicea TaxID=6063 RepID=UPI00312B75BC
MDAPTKMWSPNGQETKMDEFRERVNKELKLTLKTYADLWQWSVDRYDQFWEQFFHYSTLQYSCVYEKVVDTSKNIAEIPEWFQGCRMNYAENLLQHQDDKTAIITYGEGQEGVSVSFSELRQRVATLAAAMRGYGIGEGDRVVGYLPNSSFAVEAMLATASIGAVWSSTSPDFGVSGVLDRFTQIKPKLIFSVEAVRYNNKTHSHLQKLSEVVAGLPALEMVVIFPFCGTQNIDTSSIPNSVLFEDFVEDFRGAKELKFAQLPFNHPLFIMFSSGTTGVPKCMVHSAGGTLIQHLKEHILHGNMTSSDVMFYYTTTGWMMWNWLVSALAVGATIVLYDGSPFIPSPNVLWDCVDKFGITILGTGAKWLSALEERNIHPIETHSLTSLHTILSTGSPLKPQSYDYVYTRIKDDIMLGSISGGTDIISCFAGQNPTVPVYRGELQSRNLGMAVECWDTDGKEVLDDSGELVCTKPFPSMPTHFWNDDDGIKYTKAYFTKFQGVWAHGDYCVINSRTGGIVMLGRSDGTLNPAGVRFGSAEIYNIIEHMEGIADSLCVGQRISGGDERVILFLKMTPGHSFSEDIVKKVKVQLRTQLSARHVPAVVLETTDIPYTINAKKVEVAVKKIISGEEVQQRGALANPQSLDLYYNIPELQLSGQNH